MKRILIACALLIGLSACARSNPETLKIYNWGVYIDESLIDEFEETYNCTVIYDTFDSNESMYTKLQSGERYDVIYPSDYMVQRLIDEHQLQPLAEKTRLDLEGFLPAVLHRAFDPENSYSVPYFWGNVGILYNTKIVSEQDLKAGWDLLVNPNYKGQLYFYDSERDAFMVALKALGYSTNTTVASELDAAYGWLKQLNATMEPVYVTDDVIDNMIAGNKAIAVVYSGDAAYILDENPDMGYYVPEEGTNIWIDSMVIPANAPNATLANHWIQFMMQSDAATRNTLEVGYTTVRQDVYDQMLAEDYAQNPAYQVRMDNAKDEVFVYDEDLKLQISELWLKIKAE